MEWTAWTATAHRPAFPGAHAHHRCRPRSYPGAVSPWTHHRGGAGEGDILRFAEIRLVELASPLEVGHPVLAPTRPAFLAGGVSEIRTPERKRARRRISKPGSPGRGAHPDPRITSQPGDVEYPVCHVGSAPRHAYPAKLPKLPNMLGGV